MLSKTPHSKARHLSLFGLALAVQDGAPEVVCPWMPRRVGGLQDLLQDGQTDCVSTRCQSRHGKGLRQNRHVIRGETCQDCSSRRGWHGEDLCGSQRWIERKRPRLSGGAEAIWRAR